MAWRTTSTSTTRIGEERDYSRKSRDLIAPSGSSGSLAPDPELPLGAVGAIRKSFLPVLGMSIVSYHVRSASISSGVVAGAPSIAQTPNRAPAHATPVRAF